MRPFKPKNINWKYILGEVLLIFIGINSAIWFNNWNESNRMDSKKEIAIDKIRGEIQNNLNELINAREINIKIPKMVRGFNALNSSSTNAIETSPVQMASFQKLYPGYFRIRDSVKLNDSIYSYGGGTALNLELPELSEIAWETSKDMGIALEFGYECLYNLEGMYNVQHLVQNEIDKAVVALQNQDIEQLIRILSFVHQLDIKLESDYNTMLETTDDCMLSS